MYIKGICTTSNYIPFIDISNMYVGDIVASSEGTVREVFAVRTYTKTLREETSGKYAFKILANEQEENVVRLDDCRAVFTGPEDAVFPAGPDMVRLYNPPIRVAAFSGVYADLSATAERWLREVSVERSAD